MKTHKVNITGGCGPDAHKAGCVREDFTICVFLNFGYRQKKNPSQKLRRVKIIFTMLFFI